MSSDTDIDDAEEMREIAAIVTLMAVNQKINGKINE